MPTVNITHTDANPTYGEGHGGGRREITHTDANPTYTEGHGGGRREITHTDANPTYVFPFPGLGYSQAHIIG